MPPRIPLAIVALIAAALPLAIRIADAQQPSSTLKQHVGSLSSFDYVIRMNAARMIRRAAPADAVLALGRMGDARGRSTTAPAAKIAPEVTAAVQAAGCLLGDACASRIDWLVSTARHSDARPEAGRAAVTALGAVAEREAGARNALLQLASTPERGRTEATVAIGAWALRQPAAAVVWIAELPEPSATAAVDVLRDAFERLEEDFAEEQFFAAARAAYWSAADESATRRVAAALIDRLDF